MLVLHEVDALRAFSDEARASGLRVGLVPTMGALHDGHLALVDEARRRTDRVMVSIFVNPAQFDAASDLEAYPRTLASDLDACRDRDVDAVFAPAPEALYPDGHRTWVEVEELGEGMEGASRPGHFRGVATVVAKLLAAARPHVAVFGRKDYQQLALIRRLATDLCLGVEVVGHPTVREADGLALSSRNVLLTPEARAQATVVARALGAADQAYAGGQASTRSLLARVRDVIGKASLAQLDYAELRHPETLQPSGETLEGPALLALAVRFPRTGGGHVRLIDNRVIGNPDPGHEAG